MTDADLWAAWRLWMGVATVAVVILAALLVTILLTARRILAETRRALAAAEAIQKNTQCVWALDATTDVAERIAERVESVEQNTGALVAALEGTTVGRHAE